MGVRPLALLAVASLLLVACQGGPPAPSDPEVARGRLLYAQVCQQCHGDASTGAGRIPTAPPHSPEGHTWHHADGQIVDIVLGRFDFPGRTMPSFAGLVTEQDVQAILAYLKTNWTEEQRSFQAEASRNWEKTH
ncbi:MAG: cytochrome c [Chloroflexi bacterium]|nr:cytochrome c [Chloroflexota bacterium]